VAVPIELRETPDAEPRRLTDGAAVWAKPRSAVTSEEYTDFYRSLAGQYDEPALTVHWRAEGRHEYTVLAFVPGSRPLDLFDPARKGRNKLYVRRVLINQDSDLLPGWMRFVRLVVDSADLPLNVSREMIQTSPVFTAIRKGVTNRILQELTKTAETDAEAYGKIWENFGPVLKEGLYEDPERRDQLFKLARFSTTTHPEGGRSLADYVAGLKENQTSIFYLTGEDAKRMGSSPQLEGFKARGVEVLLLGDPVDAFWVSTAVGFDGKPFKSVTQGGADLKAIPLAEGAKEESAETTADVAVLLAFFKTTLESVTADVRASERLAESPACLVAGEHGPDRRLERILAQAGRAELTKPVLEINPRHALVQALAKRYGAEADTAQAFEELKASAASCPTTPVTDPTTGDSISTTITPDADQGWARTDGVDRQAYTVTRTNAATGEKNSSVVVYLRRGDILLGVYFPEPDGPQMAVEGKTTIPEIVKIFEDRLLNPPTNTVPNSGGASGPDGTVQA
jgi:molecular chaperone HtpG